MVEITLTDEQRQKAYREGCRRQSYNELAGIKGRNKGPETGEYSQWIHLIGSAAEMAVAVHLGMEKHLYLNKTPVKGSCDLPGIDVKCVPRSNYRLLIQLDDDPSKIFVLVTIENKKIFINGWIRGEDAMIDRWKAEPSPGRPCYALPPSTLNPIEELKCLLALS